MMNEEIPARSKVMRGAMAVACSLWAPIVLAEGDSREAASASNSVQTGAPAIIPDSAAQAAIFRETGRGCT